MTEDEVRTLFMTVGPLQTCKIIKDKQSQVSLGYAFVNYVNVGDADIAIQKLNGMPLQNKTIKVSYARPSSSNIMNANLYIAYLPKTLTQPELEAMFRHYGTIITSKILVDPETNMSRGVGFVRYDKHSEAENAILALNGKHLPGSMQPMLVKFANQAKPGNASIPMQATVNGMASLSRRVNTVFNSSGTGGPMRHTLGSNIRYNPVSMNSGISAVSAINPIATPTATPVGSQGYCLFVFNIPEQSQNSLLYQLFGPFGAITSVKIIRDPEGKCKGFGFVNMVTYESAYHAICALNGFILEGKALQVSFKKD